MTRILKPRIRGGYLYFGLWQENFKKNHRLNRLVAIAFIDNPEIKPFVDHINGNITNNNVENLRWATNTENNRNRKLSIETALRK